ncbi:MAG: EAL domain-containing protein [Coriobacteriales bacterium]|nr:EAL domain-containing protein [Coriobacteriales bacterium]
MHSIRFKAIAITIAAVLTAVLSVSVASFLIIQTEIENRSVEMMNLIAQDSRKSIEKYTDGIVQSVQITSNRAVDMLDSVVLARDGVVGANGNQAERTPEQVEHLDTYLAEYTNAIQAEFSSVASRTNGAISYYYCISPGVSTTEHGFFYSRAGRSGFSEQEPLDANRLDPSDPNHDTWYYTPIKAGSPAWVGPYEARFLGYEPVCSYVVPIYKSGTFIGVLGMDIPVEEFVSLVSSIHVYNTGFACLLDKNGQVLYYPGLAPGGTLKLPIDEEVLRQEDNGDALIRSVRDDVEYQMSFTTLATGMKLVIVAPTSEVYASSVRLTHVIPPIAAIVIILFACLTFLAMRHVTSPLQSLTAASRRLAEADYDVELGYRGHDEVGALTDAFQRMRNQLQTYIADLNQRAQTDDLTGLPNQRHFFELAADELRLLLDNGESPVLLYFNLVGMKQFNRQFGFEEGDRTIRKVARILARHFGEQHASRFGQDHFAVITSDDRLEERLYEVFDECSSANGGNMPPVSVGIYRYSMGNVDVSVACDRAKHACDRRRGSYYSGFRYFDESMLRQAEVFRYVVSHLDQALSERWIQVHYQPIVRSVNGRVCDEEALSRWVDPNRGNLSPAEFITALEDSGLIYKLDLYVLDQILEKIQRQQEAGLTIVPHSVNLSRADFDSLDMVEEIRRRVDAAGVSRDRITIEITESIIGSDFAFMKQQVERFQSLGFPVWMDDFGSGYSSLNFLQSIKFDLLKFDMSFLRRIDEGTDGKIILTELVQMATALGVDTLCEGVETQDQVRFLREIGCSKMQGFYYCRAIPLSQIIDRYRSGTQIGYENPAESDYYEAIGKLNLLDLTSIVQKNDGTLHNIFNTLPMGVMEIKGDRASFVRTSQSYRDFVMRYFGFDLANPAHDVFSNPTKEESQFVRHVQACGDTDSLVFFDEVMPEGHVVHFLARSVRTNPVTNTTAVAIAVLSIDEPSRANHASVPQIPAEGLARSLGQEAGGA